MPPNMENGSYLVHCKKGDEYVGYPEHTETHAAVRSEYVLAIDNDPFFPGYCSVMLYSGFRIKAFGSISEISKIVWPE